MAHRGLLQRATAALTIATVQQRTIAFCLHSPALQTNGCSSHGLLSSSRIVFKSAMPATTSSSNTAASSQEDDTLNIPAKIASVRQRINHALSSSNRSEETVTLVAVSKTKPLELLMAAYEAGQRHFGENYAQELMTKSTQMPDDVSWHFIGPLQSNKAATLVKTLGLYKLTCIETVSSGKLASKLNRAVETWNLEIGLVEPKKLGIYIQVNTSDEDTKNGVCPGLELVELVQTISNECPMLSIDGLMTIGAPGNFSCFDTLVHCRDEVAIVLGRNPKELALSMGMSGDFEIAIAKGATSVRVGSTIFGERDYSKVTS